MSEIIKKAETIKEIFFLFDPHHFLENKEQLDAFYIDRDSLTRKRIALATEKDLMTRNPVHILFTGHRGCGKSTEINKLCLELDDNFLIVKVSFNNRPDIDYMDVLLKAAMALFKAATEEQIIKKAPAQIISDLWQDIAIFINNKVFGLQPNPEFSASANLSLTSKLNTLVGELEAKFEIEPQSRDECKKNSERLFSELVSKINILSKEIRDKYQKPVLFIFEEADKIDLEFSEKLFYTHTGMLTSIRASAIYVIDIALRYNPRFSIVEKDFSCFVLPNIKLHDSQGNPLAANKQRLRNVIECRADVSLFTEEAIELLISSSGGLLRSLIDLTQAAASHAAVENSAQINASHVQQAINERQGAFINRLKAEHYPLLLKHHETKLISSDADTQDLLQSLALLEYENGTTWCDVHPVILPEVQKRTR